MALIDVTPIMTSNTTPIPYVVSTSSEYNSSQQGWKAFNGIKNANADAYWGTSLNTPTGWIKLDFGKNTKTMAFSISSCILKTTSTDNLLRNPKDFTLYGSYDGIDYFKIVELENEMNWEIGETRVYSYNPVDFRYYKLSVNKNNGDSTIMLITELRYLYDDSYDKSVSHTYASLNYQLPMAPTDIIKSRINDTREGLAVIASDQENYGDLYVVGKDGRSHLIKSAIKSEIIFEGYASGSIVYDLATSIYEFKQLLVTASGNNNEFFTMMINTNTIKIKETYQFLFNFSTEGNDRQIIFNFPSVTSFKIPYRALGGYSNIGINQIVGIY